MNGLSKSDDIFVFAYDPITEETERLIINSIKGKSKGKTYIRPGYHNVLILSQDLAYAKEIIIEKGDTVNISPRLGRQ